MTIRERIWNLLREGKPLNVLQITERLDLPYRPGENTPCKVASDALYQLRRSGCVKASKGKAPVYKATNKPPPGLGYGATVRWRNRKITEPKPKPVAPCALAEAWGWIASPSPHAQAEE